MSAKNNSKFRRMDMSLLNRKDKKIMPKTFGGPILVKKKNRGVKNEEIFIGT